MPADHLNTSRGSRAGREFGGFGRNRAATVDAAIAIIPCFHVIFWAWSTLSSGFAGVLAVGFLSRFVLGGTIVRAMAMRLVRG